MTISAPTLNPLNVAVVQLCSTEDVAWNLDTIETQVRAASEAGASVVALPENAAYLRTHATAEAPVQTTEGAIVSRFRAIAEAAQVWLHVGSFHETSPDPKRHYNTSLVIDGTTGGAPITASYRKLHLFDIDVKGSESQRESDYFIPGEDVVCTSVAGVKTGLSICYDLRFPGMYQQLVQQGARLLTVPAAFTEFTGKDHWTILLRARAIETQTFVVAAGQWGAHGGKRRSYGKSTIVDPWGIPLCTAPDGIGWAMARLDFEAQDRIRASLPCLQHRHLAVD